MLSVFWVFMPLSLADGKWSYQELIGELNKIGLNLPFEKPAKDPSGFFLYVKQEGRRRRMLACASLIPGYLELRISSELKDRQRVVEGFSEVMGYEPFHIRKMRGGVWRVGFSSNPKMREVVLKYLEREASMGMFETYWADALLKKYSKKILSLLQRIKVPQKE
jgi:hypothetical protein